MPFPVAVSAAVNLLLAQKRVLVDTRRWRDAFVTGLMVGLVTIAPARAFDRTPDPPDPSVSGIRVHGGRVTADVHDAELVDVLEQLANAAGFHLTIAGNLARGRVTAAVTSASIEHTLHTFLQDQEMMLVYEPSGAAGDAKLVEVTVFAAPASAVARYDQGVAQRSMLLTEISRLSRAANDTRAVAMLGEFATTAPDPIVRGAAVSALARTGGPATLAVLLRAAADGSPYVRVRAAHALAAVQGAAAAATLSTLLLRDADVGVRRAAASALARLPDDASTSALAGAMADADPVVQTEARRALQRRGVPAIR
jgi:hypothetical protein